MAKRPSKKDYVAGEAETASAERAQSEYARLKKKYAPVLIKRAAESQTDAVKTNLRGRANADVAQKLTRPDLAVVENPTAAGDMAEARIGQLAVADATALKYKNDVGANVLAKASQQKGTALDGLSHASRLATSTALTKAQAKQDVAQAKLNAAVQIGSAAVSQGMTNYGQTGDAFTPGRINPEATSKAGGVAKYDPAKTMSDRWDLGTTRNF